MVRRAAVLLLAAAACAPVSSRFETLVRAPSFRVKSVAVAGVRGARGRAVEFTRALTARLQASGLRAAALDESDSVLAGSALGLEVGVDPRLLAEIRESTGADAIVLVSFDPLWRSLEAAALDARTGDPVLRVTVRPRGDSFATADEAADAAARALSVMADAPRRPDPTRVDDGLDELPVP